MAWSLDDYVPVNERIAAWYEKWPDGRIVADPFSICEVGGKTFVTVTARVYTQASDPTPSQGSAWEPYPGTTNFTRDSELQNCETSAVGRALAMAGIEVKRGIASREDVANRQRPASIADEDVARLKARLLDLPDYVQADVKQMVKDAGRRLDELTPAQLDDAHAFVTAIETELGEESPI